MIVTMYRLASIFILFLFAFLESNAQEYEGTYIKVIDNNKDIYHKKNDFVRQEMKKRAVYDLIERGAHVKVKSITRNNTISVTINDNEKNINTFIEEVQSQYNLLFKRTSNYQFEKLDDKKWKVRVKGIVKNNEIEDVNYHGSDIRIDLYEEKNTIIRKSFGKVLVRNASIPDYSRRLKVYRHKEKKTIVGLKKIKG